MTRNRIAIALLATLILGAHLALWSSDKVPREAKLRLTLLNAAGWGIILLPAVGVAMWARAHRRK